MQAYRLGKESHIVISLFKMWHKMNSQITIPPENMYVQLSWNPEETNAVSGFQESWKYMFPCNDVHSVVCSRFIVTISLQKISSKRSFQSFQKILKICFLGSLQCRLNRVLYNNLKYSTTHCSRICRDRVYDLACI